MTPKMKPHNIKYNQDTGETLIDLTNIRKTLRGNRSLAKEEFDKLMTRVEARMEEFGIIGEELAYFVGCTPASVSQWRKRKAIPSLKYTVLLNKFCEAKIV